MRTGIFVVSLISLFLTATLSEAALKRYVVRQSFGGQWEVASPNPDFGPVTGVGTAVVDNDGGSGSPVLRKLWIVDGGGADTTSLPGLSGFIWFNPRKREGPAADQVGSGDISSQIEWGNLSGWTVVGGLWCHSVPSTICPLGAAIDQETVAPALLSTNYNYTAWTFHTTGFNQPQPYVQRTAITSIGNGVVALRGKLKQTGTVPALPILAIAAVGLSVAAAGVSSIRRR